MKNGKLRGFMCQSTAVNAGCMVADPRSAMVPRRLDRMLIDDSRLLNNARYSKLVESRRFAAADHKIRPKPKQTLTPFVRREQIERQDQPKPLQKQPLQLASSDHVFQVRL
ncbi:hypothetical protein COLO4_33877 [Corchorus olitorius]|uniref:Uncharacterized protein n=1 Tax=Corchorus olitorius TaxID=93759 RepID=A0A1R3GQ91_9ROSI|nr:hypothetical protein COLO4_33877 [Corchorus olitorius]